MPEEPSHPTSSATASPTEETSPKKKKKGGRRRVPSIKVFIQSTYNNTLVTAADPDGNVLAWSSAGRIGYQGARKSTPYVANEVVRDLMKRLEPFQVKDASVVIRGIGSGRESAVRALAAHGGLALTSIRDATPIPHNGCRPPRRRRV
ncbi:MAG: small subunit ribosomal protein S11 [Parcubacteria group bacterium Gr01-1014_106]|nr:MAG: small subunit ribosomal protein S11 [Parcubacteria group bacterium Gr01-1014_106]